MNRKMIRELLFYSFMWCCFIIVVYFFVPAISGLELRDGVWQYVSGYWDDWAYLPDGTPYPIGGSLYSVSPLFPLFIAFSSYGGLLVLLAVYYYSLKEGEQ